MATRAGLKGSVAVAYQESPFDGVPHLWHQTFDPPAYGAVFTFCGLIGAWSYDAGGLPTFVRLFGPGPIVIQNQTSDYWCRACWVTGPPGRSKPVGYRSMTRKGDIKEV